jgi:tRNA1(Val) A37 N6-methylase TrmN6
VEGAATLEAWLARALALLRPRGSLTAIHRADRLDRLLAALAAGCGDLAVFPLWPRQGEAARRVLVQGRKGSGGPLRLLPGLVLHVAGGTYTPAAEAVLRDAAGLEL